MLPTSDEISHFSRGAAREGVKYLLGQIVGPTVNNHDAITEQINPKQANSSRNRWKYFPKN